MSFLMLESGALIVAALAGMEMRHQRVAWRSVVVRSLLVFVILTAMIVAWRGL